MELEFTNEQEELRASVRSFLDKECPIELVRAVVSRGGRPNISRNGLVMLPSASAIERCLSGR